MTDKIGDCKNNKFDWASIKTMRSWHGRFTDHGRKDDSAPNLEG